MDENQTEAPAVETTEAEPAKTEAESLLAKHTVSEDDQKADPIVTKENDEKVDLIAGRYKTQDEFEKAHKELRQKLSENGQIAPEAYDLKLPEGMSVEDGDPMLSKFQELAKKHDMSNEAYNEIISMKLLSDSESSISSEDEIAKLGDNAKETISAVDSFFKGKLSEDGYKAVQNFATTADAVNVLNEIRKSFDQVKPPTSNQISSQKSAVTQDDAEAALAKARVAEASNAPDAVILRNKATKAFQEVYGK